MRWTASLILRFKRLKWPLRADPFLIGISSLSWNILPPDPGIDARSIRPVVLIHQMAQVGVGLHLFFDHLFMPGE